MKQSRLLAWSLVVSYLALSAGVRAETPAKRPFLWKVESAKGTAYLLGSLHAAKPDIYPLDDRIYRAFDDSDHLVVEANLADEQMFVAAGQMLARASYADGDSADKHLSRELFDKVSVRLAKYGMPAGTFKPWFLAMTLTMLELQSAGLGAENGVDLHFLNRAKEKKKPVLELEGAMAQVEMLDGFTDKEQEAFLAYTMQDIEELPEHLGKLQDLWLHGDADGINDLLHESLKDKPDFAGVYRRLFDDRNVKMAEKIEKYLQTGGTYFVIVGAGHLVGDTGLIKLLERQNKVTHQ